MPKKMHIESLSTKLPIPLFDSVMATALLSMGTEYAGLTNVAQYSSLANTFLLAVWLSSSIPYFIESNFAKRINFQKQFGADIKTLQQQSLGERFEEIEKLTEKLNDEYLPQDYERKELAKLVNKELEDYLESITGVRVETSDRIRNFGIVKMLMPFALGACQPIDGEIYIFKDMGVFEPHVITHELAHRHGYGKELHAQALAYLALMNSKNPVFMQSANCERLKRQIGVVNYEDRRSAREFTENLDLRAELRGDFLRLMKRPGIYERVVSLAMLPVYSLRMKLTGQNGLKDYGEGFTNFLHTIGNKV
ncbi:DUF3810 family protein [Candidatus Woesearchaeota archaeon]|nr:DUF3810 family protein [Candidatus Woesearchaeota archaeon]